MLSPNSVWYVFEHCVAVFSKSLIFLYYICGGVCPPHPHACAPLMGAAHV